MAINRAEQVQALVADIVRDQGQAPRAVPLPLSLYPTAADYERCIEPLERRDYAEHRALVLDVQARLIEVGINAVIVNVIGDEYRRWQRRKRLPNNTATRARYVAEKFEGVLRISK